MVGNSQTFDQNSEKFQNTESNILSHQSKLFQSFSSGHPGMGNCCTPLVPTTTRQPPANPRLVPRLVPTKERQSQRNGTNAMDPDAMAVAATKRGETETSSYANTCETLKVLTDYYYYYY
jgi:hypothetical protein